MSFASLRRAEFQLKGHRSWLVRFASHARPSTHCTWTCAELPPNLRPKTDFWSAVRACRPSTKSLLSTYATKSRKGVKGRSLYEANEREKYEEQGRLLEGLLAATRQNRIQEVIQSYNQLQNKNLLSQFHVKTIARCLHQCMSVEKRLSEDRRSVNLEELIAFGKTLVRDIQQGTIVKSSAAHVQLINFFNACGGRAIGVRFWQWLETQDDFSATADVYGAAIDLLAFNGSPLHELEELYHKGLARFPGTFNSYHLSPNAIVPDRAQEIDIQGIPLALLGGVLVARLLRGELRDSYLALDTALRLFPDHIPSRFFEAFIEERPLFEAYNVFAMASRAGIKISKQQFKRLIASFRAHARLDSPTKAVALLRGMFSTAYLHLGAGGKMESTSASEIVIAVAQVIQLKGASALSLEAKSQLIDAIYLIIRRTMEIFSLYGYKPTAAAYNKVIYDLGGHGGSRQVIEMTLNDIQSHGLLPTDATQRSVLAAAGLQRDPQFVIESWIDLVKARTDAGRAPEPTDFHILIKAAHQSGCISYARQQFDGLKEFLPANTHQRIAERFDQREADLDLEHSKLEPLEISSLLKGLSKVLADLDVFKTIAEGKLTMRDFECEPLPMTLLAPEPEMLPEAEMRKLYDELTTDPGETSRAGAQKLTPEKVTPARSITNIPFDNLRYENWKSINYLLRQADHEVIAYNKAIDQAIAKGVSPPQRHSMFYFPDDQTIRSHGISDAVPCTIHDNGSTSAASLEDTSKMGESSGGTATVESSDERRQRETIDEQAWSSEQIQAGRDMILKLRGSLNAKIVR